MGRQQLRGRYDGKVNHATNSCLGEKKALVHSYFHAAECFVKDKYILNDYYSLQEKEGGENIKNDLWQRHQWEWPSTTCLKKETVQVISIVYSGRAMLS